MNVVAILKLIRVKQWIKNIFVFGPLIFSKEFLEPDSLFRSFLAFFFFCVAASATYILNDIKDVEKDKTHPKKRFRPIAAGQISVKFAYVLYGIFAVLLLGSFSLGYQYVLSVFAYLLLNVAYSNYLKHQPVLDIFSIATGFVIRVVAGAVAIPVPLSSWMFITTLCLALYLASIKRRQELQNHGADNRDVLGQYSIALVDKYAEMSAIGAIIFYSLFIVTTEPRLSITIPIVLFGLFRYWYSVENLDNGESPTDTLLGDYQLLFTCFLWIVISAVVLWPGF
jgi:decaprenyl-phosphate phosphoribosyltransferase